MFNYKQCIVVRTDLKISCPKLCVQVAHASIDSFLLSNECNKKDWYKEGQKKVILSVKSEEEIYELETRANELNIKSSIIQDLGYTELEPNTTTCIVFEILPNEVINKLTGNLPILKIK